MRHSFLRATCAALLLVASARVSTAQLNAAPPGEARTVAALPTLPVAPVTISVEPGARQIFRGLGASLFPWTPSKTYLADVPSAQNQAMMQMLWRDARFKSVRLWMHPGEEPVSFYVDGYVKTGKLPEAIRAGATDLILAPDHIPSALGDGKGLIRDEAIPVYAGMLADFIRDFRSQSGILINYAGVLNEPNDRPVKFSVVQWPLMIRAFRTALDERGLKQVGIVAPESANCGSDAYAVVDAIQSDARSWAALSGVATHSYTNAATPDMAKRVEDKDYWITEAGGITDRDEDAGNALEAASVASRFLNDVNQRVTHWQFFIGAEYDDPNGNTGRILKFSTKPFRLTALQKYFYLKQLGEAFDVGCRFRHATSSLDGEMTYSFNHAPDRKPRVSAACAQNPDGSWSIGLSNFTSNFFQSPDAPSWYREQGGASAQPFLVTVRVPELLGLGQTLRFVMHRSNAGKNDVSEGLVKMRGGQLKLLVSPLDLVTLRSLPGK